MGSSANCRKSSLSKKVMFSDESCFSRDGFFNCHNSHIWSEDNPHGSSENHHQHKFSVNVRAGIVGDCLIGPYLLPPRLNALVYEIFLAEVLPDLFDEYVTLDQIDVLNDMRLQHDGAPAQFGIGVRTLLNNTYPGWWIGRGGPVEWPPRSPYLTPIDFCLWGYIKSLVYETPVETEEELIARIVAAFDKVRNTPGIFARIRQSFINRCNLCIERGGRVFENCLQGPFKRTNWFALCYVFGYFMRAKHCACCYLVWYVIVARWLWFQTLHLHKAVIGSSHALHETLQPTFSLIITTCFYFNANAITIPWALAFQLLKVWLWKSVFLIA